MKVCVKAAVDGGAGVIRKTLYIVEDPVDALRSTYVTSKTVVGGVAKYIGEKFFFKEPVSNRFWGYLVEVEQDEYKPAGGESEEDTPHIVNIITHAKEMVVDGIQKISVTLYGQTEPTIYTMEYKFTDFMVNPFARWVPKVFQKVYETAIAEE